MVLKCYHYKFNDTSQPACEGSFSECAQLNECLDKDGNSICFALAKLESSADNVTILSAGCFPAHPLGRSYNDLCLGEYRASGDNYYCNCNTDACNGKLIPGPKPAAVTPTPSPEMNNSVNNSHSNHSVILLVIVVVITVILGLYVRKSRLNRKVKMDRNNLLALADLNTNKKNETAEVNEEITEPEPKYDLKNVQLLELVGSGRFGTVHKANLTNNTDPPSKENEEEEASNGETQKLITKNEIAVKIINNNEYQSFHNELTIYNLARMRHPNILTFLGSSENPDTNSHWLLVEYAANGSLHHYLKEKTINWDEFLKIALGIVRGLSHLHDADVAHRDFKSKNVLLRQDLSPCITDFGVATILDMVGGSHNQPRKNYLQVGTPRYMAPEVLECSVAFTKISFTKIDVYALSLVLWELLTRCHPLPNVGSTEQDILSTRITLESDAPKDQITPYKMPFEDQVGTNPDIETMKQIVVSDGFRPPFKESWSYYPLSKISQAIVDGWEYDHDARISASCFVERIESLLPRRHVQIPSNQMPVTNHF